MLRAYSSARVSSISLVLVAITCAATAAPVLFLSSDEKSNSKKPANSKELDEPNQACNGVYGPARPSGFDCTHGFVCMDTARMIRKTCRECRRRGWMSPGEHKQCRNIVPKSTFNTVKGVQLHCVTTNFWNRYGKGKNDGCVSPVVDSRGWTSWGATGMAKICGCVQRFVVGCKGEGLSCVLDKIDHCPMVCPGIKARIKDARENSLMEARVEEQLQDRARVFVDAHGKVSRNASASIMSLDNTMAGKCAV